MVAVLRRESTGGCASGLAPAETAPTSSANSPTSPDAGSLAARRRTRLSGRGWQDFSALRRRLAAHGRARCGRTPRPGDVDRLDVLHHDGLCLRPDPTIPFLSVAGPMRASALATIRSSAGCSLVDLVAAWVEPPAEASWVWAIARSDLGVPNTRSAVVGVRRPAPRNEHVHARLCPAT